MTEHDVSMEWSHCMHNYETTVYQAPVLHFCRIIIYNKPYLYNDNSTECRTRKRLKAQI